MDVCYGVNRLVDRIALTKLSSFFFRPPLLLRLTDDSLAPLSLPSPKPLPPPRWGVLFPLPLRFAGGELESTVGVRCARGCVGVEVHARRE